MKTVSLKKSWVSMTWIPTIIGIAGFMLALVTFFAPHLLSSPAKMVQQTEQQKFWSYIEQHGCRRVVWYVLPFKEEIRYTCDNGWWREVELMEVANGRYVAKHL